MNLWGREIHDRFYGGVESFQDQDARDGQDQHAPFRARDLQPGGEGASDKSDEQFDSGVALRAKEICDAGERVVKAADQRLHASAHAPPMWRMTTRSTSRPAADRSRSIGSWIG